ncbi:class III signal peptide-containing protein [Methanothermobacter sp.]|uniref:class III signal peptide-containing protein n=1 Tax=Methanothermobacter sp. TaxID=1884223 RepID=UPI00261B0184|nr:class III signal peptide-containing protein [Methanothermobacter sp.]MDI9617595.1 class III signal peptide-containing protein [Methanothermobacter sp.]
MDSRGQVSLEYLLLILVVILVLGGVTIPLIGSSIEASTDVSRASDAKVAVQTLADAANIVYSNGPGAKRTVSFYLPVDGVLLFENNRVIFTVTYSNGTKSNITAQTLCNFTPEPTRQINKGWYRAVVYWPINSTNVRVANITRI